MQDLTHGPIPRHVLTMAAPVAAGMLLQMLYYIVDLYFVAQLGDAPIAGVSGTSPVMFVVFALPQILGVGTVALMSHAVGGKDRADASHVFNQSVALAALCAAATLAGGEFALMALFMGVVYWVIRDFGAAAQAGFGIGMRVMQAIFLPAMAIAFPAAPIAGQNFGAKRPERVRETFRTAAGASCASMALLTLVCHWQSAWLVRTFTADPAVIEVGVDYLRVISWNFVGADVVFVCSSLFQGLVNLAVARDERVAPAALRRPGSVAIATVRLPPRRSAASLGGDGAPAGGPEPSPAAPGIPRAPRHIAIGFRCRQPTGRSVRQIARDLMVE